MNLVDAYLENQRRPRGARQVYGGVLQVSCQLLETMLELPPGVRIISMDFNPLYNSMQIVMQSDRPIDDYTTEVHEGMMLPNMPLDNIVANIQRRQNNPP